MALVTRWLRILRCRAETTCRDCRGIDTIPVVATSAEDRLGQPRQRNRSRGILTHPGSPLGTEGEIVILGRGCDDRNGVDLCQVEN